MTARERFLAILVGGLILAVGLNWGFNRYRQARQFRSNRIQSLTDERQRLQEMQLQGAFADRQMGEYLARSLPSDPEQAQNDYYDWLLDWVGEHDLGEPNVDPQASQSIQDSANQPLYRQFTFRVTGQTDLPRLIDLLHGFYAKDYLHRIRRMTVNRGRDDALGVTMVIDAVALNAALPDAAPPEQTSWRVDENVAAYREAILNRNFYEPPNEEPRFEGEPEIEAIVGESTRSRLTFRDPEGHPIRFELAGDPPEFVELDPEDGSLRLSPTETGEYELLVRAVDSGYPNRSVEQKLVVNVTDPPAPSDEPEPDFDDARLTVLTALVEGREGWTAWLNVRTQGKTEKLRIGDGFQIGSVEGKVVDATPRHATIEAGGKRFQLRPGQSLAEAAQADGSE